MSEEKKSWVERNIFRTDGDDLTEKINKFIYEEVEARAKEFISAAHGVDFTEKLDTALKDLALEKRRNDVLSQEKKNAKYWWIDLRTMRASKKKPTTGYRVEVLEVDRIKFSRGTETDEVVREIDEMKGRE